MKNMKSENAVSPVIGVILMVVITVIIAAILAVFAFGVGSPAKAPEAQLRFIATNGTGGNNYLNITNAGGDSLILKDEQITISIAATGTNLIGPINMSSWATSPVPLPPQYLAPGKTIGGSAGTVSPGDIILIQVLDAPTGQLIANAKVTVH